MNRKQVSELRTRRQKIARKLPEAETILRGSLIERFIPCGKPGCICKEKGGHGPYLYLTINRGKGRTVCIKIPASKKDEVETMVNNYRQMRKGLECITEINLELLIESKSK